MFAAWAEKTIYARASNDSYLLYRHPGIREREREKDSRSVARRCRRRSSHIDTAFRTGAEQNREKRESERARGEGRPFGSTINTLT